MSNKFVCYVCAMCVLPSKITHFFEKFSKTQT
nr:MAG TPA: hypothetical protein [Bacteriophage sp.]